MKIEIELTDAQVAQIAAKASTAPVVAPVTGLRPGQVVVDVGTLAADEGPYTGTLNPDTLTVYDWAFYAQNPRLWAIAGKIFSKKPIMRDPDSGRIFHQGDLANTVDTSAYRSNGGVLALY